MDAGHPWPRVGSIAERALDLESGEPRSAYLDRVCGTDTEIRRRVEELLEADRRAGPFLEVPAAAGLAGELLAESRAARFPDRRIGPYRILRPLGSGGAGEVYLAARADEQFEQQVALKVLRQRPGLDDTRRRILAERQILARLEHPNIARLYDGGTTEDGRPYLVMEYVDGVPIDDYCQGRRLSIDERIDLFSTLCAAVQFAHQRFFVHRDLKPSNILVTADGDLKLLDFSIAKAISPDHDPLAAETATGATPMTVAYASPEQIRGEPVTTATDVHGLGIVLYQILTGRHPFRDVDSPLHVVAEAVCRREPAPPSRVRSSDRSPDAAGGGDPALARKLEKRLAGDLDAIVLKALQKDPRDRYSSVDQLAEDLRRYRRQLPIEARPPSFRYRLRKAVARHRALLLVAGAVGLLIVAFVIALVGQIRRADSEAARAALEAERAEREARSAAEVADFLVGVFQVFDPTAGQGGKVTARELLDRSVERAQSDLATQPASLARILQHIGVAYRQLGLYDAAAEVFEESLSIRGRVFGERSPEVAESLRYQAEISWTLGDHGRAEELLWRSLAIVRSEPEPDELAVAAVLHGLAVVSWLQGRFSESEGYSRQALRIRSARLGDSHLDVARTLANLALALSDQNRADEAEAAYLEAIAIREQSQRPDHPDIASILSNLASLYAGQGRDAEAETLFTRTLEIRRHAYDDDHPLLGGAWLNLGIIYLESGRLAGAEEALTEARRILTAAPGPDHPWSGAVTSRLAELRLEQGRLGEAESLAVQAGASLERSVGPLHPWIAETAEIYGRVLARLGRDEESERRLAKAHEVYLAVFGEEHPDVVKFCAAHPASCARDPEAVRSDSR